MKRLFTTLLYPFIKAFRAFPLVCLVVLVISFSLILGGRHVWMQAHNKSEKSSVDQTTASMVDKPILIEQKIEMTSDEEDEEGEGEEQEEEEEEDEKSNSNSTSLSSWTLLNTALHERYSAPTVKHESPSVVMVLTGLGLNTAYTKQLLATLDKKITLAFSPYSSNLKEQLQTTISSGYHVLVTFPMEPQNYPNPDPGPLTVLTGAKPTENHRKTMMLLENVPSGISLLGEYGSKFLTSQIDLEPVLIAIKEHGSSFIDPNSTMSSQVKHTCKALNMPYFLVDMTLSSNANADELGAFIKNVIQNSKENGTVIITVPAIPAVVNQMHEWIDILNKNGINLVTMAEISTPEMKLDFSRNDQGIKDVNQKDPHQPR